MCAMSENEEVGWMRNENKDDDLKIEDKGTSVISHINGNTYDFE